MALSYVGLVATAQEQANFGYDGTTSTVTTLDIEEGDVVIVVAQCPGNVGDCIVGSLVPIVARHHLGHPSGGEILETALFARYYSAPAPAGTACEVVFTGLFSPGVWVGFEAHLFRGFVEGMSLDGTHQGDGPWTVVVPNTFSIGYKRDAAPNNLYDNATSPPTDDQVLAGPTLPTVRKRELHFFAIHVAGDVHFDGSVFVPHTLANTTLTAAGWTVTKRYIADIFVEVGWWFGWRISNEPEGVYPVEGTFDKTQRWGILWGAAYSLVDPDARRGSQVSNLHTRRLEYLVAWSEDGALRLVRSEHPSPPFAGDPLELGEGNSPCLAFEPRQERVHLLYEQDGTVYRRVSDSDGESFWSAETVMEGLTPCERFDRSGNRLTAGWVETEDEAGELHGLYRDAGDPTEGEEFLFRDFDTEAPLSVTGDGFSFSWAGDGIRWVLAAYKEGESELTHWQSWDEGRHWKEIT